MTDNDTNTITAPDINTARIEQEELPRLRFTRTPGTDWHLQERITIGQFNKHGQLVSKRQEWRNVPFIEAESAA